MHVRVHARLRPEPALSRTLRQMGVSVSPAVDDRGWSGRLDAAEPEADTSAGPTHLLVTGPATEEPAIRHEAALLAAGTSLPVAWRALPMGPAAVAHTVQSVLQLSNHPASVVTMLDLAVAHAFAAAWLPRVSRLADPAPRLNQHLRSWLPGGAGYLAVHLPDPTVLAVDRRRPADVSPDPSGSLLVCGDGAPQAAVDLAVSLSRSSRVIHCPGADATTRYGVPGAVEMLALPPLLGVDVQGGDRCPVCGLGVVTEACPYCRVAVSPLVEGAHS